MPATVNTAPAVMVIQNAVERSASVSVGRWISAAPSAMSANTSTRLANTSTIAAMP
jgi:hypothetical protein